jgi:hypothetical protein
MLNQKQIKRRYFDTKALMDAASMQIDEIAYVEADDLIYRNDGTDNIPILNVRDSTVQLDSAAGASQPAWSIQQIRQVDILLDGADLTMTDSTVAPVNQDLQVTIENVGSTPQTVTLSPTFGHAKAGSDTDTFTTFTVPANSFRNFNVRTSSTLWRWSEVPAIQSNSLSNFFIDERGPLATSDIQDIVTNSQADWNIVAPAANRVDLSTPSSTVNPSGDFTVNGSEIVFNKAGTYSISFNASGIGDNEINQYWQMVRSGTVETVIQGNVTPTNNFDGLLGILTKTVVASAGDTLDFRFNGSQAHTIQCRRTQSQLTSYQQQRWFLPTQFPLKDYITQALRGRLVLDRSTPIHRPAIRLFRLRQRIREL